MQRLVLLVSVLIALMAFLYSSPVSAASSEGLMGCSSFIIDGGCSAIDIDTNLNCAGFECDGNTCHQCIDNNGICDIDTARACVRHITHQHPAFHAMAAHE